MSRCLICRSLDWRKLRFDLGSTVREANKHKQPPHSSMSRPDVSGQALPLEVILPLQRILDLQHGNDVGAFDGVTGQFDTVGFLNQLFPTGQSISGAGTRVDVLIEE